MKTAGIVAACLILLSSCVSVPSSRERQEVADALAASSGWRPLSVTTEHFTLRAYRPVQMPHNNEVVTVYLEGDGVAWFTKSQPSSDPTPISPQGLKLALAHPDNSAVYLARPCQYISSPACAARYWTSHRFSVEIIEACSQALDQLKQQTGTQRFVLVGYSGGGALAALLASQRNDVEKLITVAGNLDHRAWTELHHISPLVGSLNPIDRVNQLARVRQVHFVGEQDRVMPASIARGFAAGFDEGSVPEIKVIPGYDHRCCWAETWSQLLRQTEANGE